MSNEEIIHSLAHGNLNNDTTKDPNISYNILHNIIQYAKVKHMPQKVIKLIKHKHKISVWITHGIVWSIQYRDNMYKKHKMTNTHSPEFDIQKINLKKYNSILKKGIRLAKKTYYELLFKKKRMT